MSQFSRYLGIDYSGAKTPTESLSGLRVFAAEGSSSPPVEISPPPSQRKYWTRNGLAHWLAGEINSGPPTLIGIDHAFSFPLRYFAQHDLPRDWTVFLDDFHAHWPTDEENTYVSSVRDGLRGLGHKRQGDAAWLRLTEQWTVSAKSVFQFDVQGQVATSTHAGLPWLRFLRSECGARLQIWPFDGWEISGGKSVVAEVYPSLWMKRYRQVTSSTDQHAAYAAASWLQRADRDGSLTRFLLPCLNPEEHATANVEGWILGVT